jgi:hypothetical protein
VSYSEDAEEEKIFGRADNSDGMYYGRKILRGSFIENIRFDNQTDDFAESPIEAAKRKKRENEQRQGSKEATRHV